MEKLDEIDHLRIRAAIAEEALAHRNAADSSAVRQHIQQALSAKYGLCERDSLDVPSGVIARAPKLAIVPPESGQGSAS